MSYFDDALYNPDRIQNLDISTIAEAPKLVSIMLEKPAADQMGISSFLNGNLVIAELFSLMKNLSNVDCVRLYHMEMGHIHDLVHYLMQSDNESAAPLQSMMLSECTNLNMSTLSCDLL